MNKIFSNRSLWFSTAQQKKVQPKTLMLNNDISDQNQLCATKVTCEDVLCVEIPLLSSLFNS